MKKKDLKHNHDDIRVPDKDIKSDDGLIHPLIKTMTKESPLSSEKYQIAIKELKSAKTNLTEVYSVYDRRLQYNNEDSDKEVVEKTAKAIALIDECLMALH